MKALRVALAFAVACLLWPIGVLPAAAAPPSNISMSVGVCSPWFPQRCVQPDASGNTPTTVAGQAATDVALSGTNPTTLATYDNSTTNYSSAALTFTAAGSGASLFVKCAADGSNYITLSGLVDGASTGATTTPTVGTGFVLRYNIAGCKSLQVLTTGGSGTVTGNMRLTYATSFPGFPGTMSVTGTVTTSRVSAGTSITAASGNVANASAAATLAGVASKTTYITGFMCTGAGATAASVVNLTVTGLISGTQTYTFVFPAGATTAAAPVSRIFANPVPASATNTAIVVTLPAAGAGNTNATCNAEGFQL